MFVSVGISNFVRINNIFQLKNKLARGKWILDDNVRKSNVKIIELSST